MHPDETPYTAALPFVAMSERPKAGEFPLCFWTAETSRDWDADYRRGQAYGRQALEAIAKDRFPGLLIHIVAEMMKRRKYDIIMIGFFQALGDAFVPPDRPTH